MLQTVREDIIKLGTHNQKQSHTLISGAVLQNTI